MKVSLAEWNLVYDTSHDSIVFMPNDVPISRWEFLRGERSSYLVGAGLGYQEPNRVRLFDQTGLPTNVDFFAYGAGHYGVDVAAGNIDLSRLDEIVTGPGPGPIFGPQVRAFEASGTPIPAISFFAFGTLKYGVNVALSDLDGKPPSEILAGAGPSPAFGPQVRAFSTSSGSLAALKRVSFLAFPVPGYGVTVAGGDVDANGLQDIVAGQGPGPSYAPRLRAFENFAFGLQPIPLVDFDAFPGAGYGVAVSCGESDGMRGDEILAAPGPSPALPARILGFSLTPGAFILLPGFDATPFASHYGARAAAMERSGAADVAVAPGPDPSGGTRVLTYRYQSGALTPLSGSFDAFPGAHDGAEVAGGILGR